MVKKRKLRAGELGKYFVIFILPALILNLLFSITPFLYTIYYSFTDYTDMNPINLHFVGLKNYIDIFTDDPVFRTSLKNNVIWALLSEIIPVLLGLAMAVFLNTKRRGFGFFRGCIFYPSVLSISTIGLIWRWMYDPNMGLINGVLKTITDGAVMINWQEPPEMTIYYLIFAGSWAYSGLCMILFLAGT